MARWVPFVGLTALVLTVLLGLARLSQGVVRDGPPELPADHAGDETATPGQVGDDSATPGPAVDDSDGHPTESDSTPGANAGEGRQPGEVHDVPVDAESTGPARSDSGGVTTRAGTDPAGLAGAPGRTGLTVETDAGDRSDTGDSEHHSGRRNLTTGALLANVALTQGLFGAVVLAGAVFYGIPGEALGVTADAWNSGLPAVAVGTVFGTALWVANEATASLADAVGASYDEGLREMLAPDSLVGWVVLLGLVLPTIAGVEEFLFRAAVIGAPAAGFGVSPWVLAVLSSAAFALGHGAQGRVGIAVTGGLGFVLAAGFILSGSLLVVVVAHYLVNALEFLVHEGLGVDRLFV